MRMTTKAGTQSHADDIDQVAVERAIAELKGHGFHDERIAAIALGSPRALCALSEIIGDGSGEPFELEQDRWRRSLAARIVSSDSTTEISIVSSLLSMYDMGEISLSVDPFAMHTVVTKEMPS